MPVSQTFAAETAPRSPRVVSGRVRNDTGSETPVFSVWPLFTATIRAQYSVSGPSGRTRAEWAPGIDSESSSM